MIRGFEDLKKEETNMQSKRNVPWANQVLAQSAKSHRAYTESPLKLWHIAENEKRRAGQQNEIDTNDILAAVKGVKNRWSELLKKYPDRFKDLIAGKPCNWQEIIDCVRNAQ